MTKHSKIVTDKNARNALVSLPYLLIVPVNHYKDKFQTETFGPLFHPPSNRPRFQQPLTNPRDRLKFRKGNRKLF